MSWNAKPLGSYTFDSSEGKENTREIASFLSSRGYTVSSQAGIAGNSFAESGLNPWRWQSDTVNISAGYGLFQYTPASKYIDGASDVQHYAPNLSTTGITVGAQPTDAIAQLTVLDSNILGTWVGTCWRSYWAPSDYPDLYEASQRILQTYGANGVLSLEQFKTINNVWDSTFAFLACFEGPAVPNMDIRYSYASTAYIIITGFDPDPPTPTPTTPRKLPLWMMLRPF